MNKFLLALLFVCSSLALAVTPPLPEEELHKMSDTVLKGFVHRIKLDGVKTEQGSETRTYVAQVYVYGSQKGNAVVGKSIILRFFVTRVAPSRAGGVVSCGGTTQAVVRLGDQAKLFLRFGKLHYEFSHGESVKLEKSAAARQDLPDEANTVQEMPIPSGLK